MEIQKAAAEKKIAITRNSTEPSNQKPEPMAGLSLVDLINPIDTF
jgi:hypothetical protein